MKKLLPTSAIALLIANSALGADMTTLVEQCDSCHGIDGVSQWSDMPTIAGISEFVHSDALFFYQDGVRPCHLSKFRIGDTERAATDMCAVSKPLSEAEIEAIAAYYAGKPFVAAKQEFDQALAERGKGIHDRECERCHTAGGSNADDDAGVLKGQWMGYLRQTFADYKCGDREQPEKMKIKLDPLSDDDVEALVHFYASPD